MQSHELHPFSAPALGKKLALLFCSAWLHLLQRLWQNTKLFLSSLSFFQILFLVSSLCVMVFSAPHWLYYSLHFESPRVSTSYTLASDLRIFCFLAGIFGIFLLFFQIPYRLFLYYAYAGILAFVFVLGFFFPNAIHSNFKDAADLHLRWDWILVWAVALAIALASAQRALQNPVLDLTKIQTWLFAQRSIARKHRV